MMTGDQNKEKNGENKDILKSRPGNPFERSQTEVDQEVKEAQKTEKNPRQGQQPAGSDPTMERLLGDDAPREAKMDRKETLKEFLKENRKNAKQEEKNNEQ